MCSNRPMPWRSRRSSASAPVRTTRAMKSEAIALGERLIGEETALDRAFADRTITPQLLADATAAIGRTQAALRATHLRYHLAQAELLSPEQMRRYAELRGYAPGGQGHSGPHHPGM